MLQELAQLAPIAQVTFIVMGGLVLIMAIYAYSRIF